MNDYYLMKYQCRNCYYGALVRVPFRTEALLYFDCPVCGLKELWKTEKDIKWDTVFDVVKDRLVIKGEK